MWISRVDWDIVLAGVAKVVKGVKMKPSLSAVVTSARRNLRRVATSVRPTWATERDPILKNNLFLLNFKTKS